MFHFHETITPRRQIWPPSLIQMEGEKEFEVKEILDSQISCGHLQYLIH
jgi:hypothetical protein